MVASNTYASNVYNRPPYEGHPVQTIVNDSRLQRSGVPVQHVITSSQVPGQMHPMGESLTYSSQFRPVISPNVQQSGLYAQRQSYVPPCSFSSIFSILIRHDKLIPPPSTRPAPHSRIQRNRHSKQLPSELPIQAMITIPRSTFPTNKRLKENAKFKRFNFIFINLKIIYQINNWILSYSFTFETSKYHP
jgi:hypothetical protein